MTVKIRASTLRRAAETADGTRDKDVCLLIREDDFRVVKCGTPPGADEILIECYTKDQGPTSMRPGIAEIKLKSKKAKEHRLEEKYDAVFWTESAVEKFVYPYYASLYRHEACERLCLLKEAWEDPKVVAIAHLPKSEPFDLDGKLLGLVGGTVQRETEHKVLVEDEATGELTPEVPEKHALKRRR